MIRAMMIIIMIFVQISVELLLSRHLLTLGLHTLQTFLAHCVGFSCFLTEMNKLGMFHFIQLGGAACYTISWLITHRHRVEHGMGLGPRAVLGASRHALAKLMIRLPPMV